LRSRVGKTKLARIAKRRTQAVIVEPRRQSVGLSFLPGVKKRSQIDHRSERPKGVPVGMTRMRPVGELDSQLVGRLRVFDEVALVDIEQSQQIDDGRNGGFAYADRADVG
jgi:hypothetical protein